MQEENDSDIEALKVFWYQLIFNKGCLECLREKNDNL